MEGKPIALLIRELVDQNLSGMIRMFAMEGTKSPEARSGIGFYRGQRGGEHRCSHLYPMFGLQIATELVELILAKELVDKTLRPLLGFEG